MVCSDRLPEGLPKELPRDLPSIEKKVITATILNPYVNLRGINLDKITNVYGRRYLIEGSNPSFPEREIGPETRRRIIRTVQTIYEEVRAYPIKVTLEF